MEEETSRERERGEGGNKALSAERANRPLVLSIPSACSLDNNSMDREICARGAVGFLRRFEGEEEETMRGKEARGRKGDDSARRMGMREKNHLLQCIYPGSHGRAFAVNGESGGRGGGGGREGSAPRVRPRSSVALPAGAPLLDDRRHG